MNKPTIGLLTMLLLKEKLNISSYRIDGTKEYHRWHSISRTPNQSSLPDHGFEF